MVKQLILITAALAIAGCGGKKSHDESTLTHAYRLIDANKDDEAIAYLEASCPSIKDNADCRVALASAFAHKAGVRIQRFVPVLNTSKSLGHIEIVFDNSQAKAETSQQIDGSLSHVSNLLTQLAAVFQIYTSVPSIRQVDAVYLEQAIHIMEELPNPRPKDAMYRAVLRVIDFKYQFAEEVVGSGKSEKLGPSCNLDLEHMTNTLSQLGRLLSSIFDDLMIATPSKSKDLQKMQTQVANETLTLTSDLSSATLVDEAANLYVKNLVIEHGLGKLLKCSEGRGAH